MTDIVDWKGHAERLRQDCEFHLAEIERLRNQIKIVQCSRVIDEGELHNMNATNYQEYKFFIKEKLARRIVQELMEKDFITFTKTDWVGMVTVTAALKVIQND